MIKRVLPALSDNVYPAVRPGDWNISFIKMMPLSAEIPVISDLFDFKVKSDGSRTAVVDQFLAICQKALNITDQMIALYPDAADENNKFASEQRVAIQKNIDYYSKPQGKPAAAPVKKG